MITQTTKNIKEKARKVAIQYMIDNARRKRGKA